MKTKFINIFIVCLLFFASNVAAVEVAPRISDREIIEKLALLEAGQNALREEMRSGRKSLREEMKSGQNALREEMKSGQNALREEMKNGQNALREEMKSGLNALREEMKIGQNALNQRITDLGEEMRAGQTSLRETIIAMFGGLIALIVALFGYIYLDRRTTIKPLATQLNMLENDIKHELQLQHGDGSLLSRQLKVLRQYASKNQEFAEIMRSVSLL